MKRFHVHVHVDDLANNIGIPVNSSTICC